MKETEYIKATNRVKISMALTIMRDVLPGEDWGITPDEVSEITRRLRHSEEKLFSLIETTEG